MERTHSLTSFSDDELLRRLSDLLGQSRRDEAALVAHIGEVDRRRLYAREASPSMFVYCTEVLHLSEAEAYLRIAAARASREHPLLLSMLADGRVHLTAIAKLAPHLTPENHDALLKRAVHRSKREIEELVAEISPRPDAPALMRKLPDRRTGRRRRPSNSARMPRRSSLGLHPAGTACLLRSDDWGEPEPRADGAAAHQPELRPDAVAAHEPEPRPDRDGARGQGLPLDGVSSREPELRPGGVGARKADLRPHGVGGVERPSADAAVPSASPRPRHAVVEPLAPGRYKVQFTASAELHDKLERLQALMRSSVPDGDLARSSSRPSPRSSRGSKPGASPGPRRQGRRSRRATPPPGRARSRPR